MGASQLRLRAQCSQVQMLTPPPSPLGPPRLPLLSRHPASLSSRATPPPSSLAPPCLPLLSRHPPQLKFGEDVQCAAACDPITINKADAARLAALIGNEYKVEWYLDGLPAATPYRTTASGRKLYEPGFRLGAVEAADDDKNVRARDSIQSMKPGASGCEARGTENAGGQGSLASSRPYETIDSVCSLFRSCVLTGPARLLFLFLAGWHFRRRTRQRRGARS